jgi:hypothetical protein
MLKLGPKMHIVNLKFELLSPACSVTIGPDDQVIWVQFRGGGGCCPRIQTDFGCHPMGTGGSFPGVQEIRT